MVMVSHQHQFVFLKTRKTAGTSLEMALEPYCRPPGAVIVEKTPTLRTAQGIVGRRLTPQARWQRLLRLRDWYNHMPAAKVRQALGAEVWGRYRKIASIRNPFDVAVSRFHWELARHGQVEAEDFAETRQQFNAMVRASNFDCDYDVLHLDGQYVADNTIRFEHMRTDLDAVVEMIAPGTKSVPIPHTKKTSNRRKRPTAEYFDAESIAAIRKSAAWAFDRFGYPETPESPETPSHERKVTRP